MLSFKLLTKLNLFQNAVVQFHHTLSRLEVLAQWLEQQIGNL